MLREQGATQNRAPVLITAERVVLPEVAAVEAYPVKTPELAQQEQTQPVQ